MRAGTFPGGLPPSDSHGIHGVDPVMTDPGSMEGVLPVIVA